MQVFSSLLGDCAVVVRQWKFTCEPTQAKRVAKRYPTPSKLKTWLKLGVAFGQGFKWNRDVSKLTDEHFLGILCAHLGQRCSFFVRWSCRACSYAFALALRVKSGINVEPSWFVNKRAGICDYQIMEVILQRLWASVTWCIFITVWLDWFNITHSRYFYSKKRTDPWKSNCSFENVGDILEHMISAELKGQTILAN